MKWTVLSPCVLLALVFICCAQPLNQDRYKLRNWIWNQNHQNRHLYCKPWCGLRQQIGSACGSPRCVCVENAPGKPRLPFSCIWSPARDILEEQAQQKIRQVQKTQ
uniref:Putative secreted protein n=1 Tax=Amblyomma triste TaxID=251400 RepID=A0A023G1J2_AMBTT